MNELNVLNGLTADDELAVPRQGSSHWSTTDEIVFIKNLGRHRDQATDLPRRELLDLLKLYVVAAKARRWDHRIDRNKVIDFAEARIVGLMI